MSSRKTRLIEYSWKYMPFNGWNLPGRGLGPRKWNTVFPLLLQVQKIVSNFRNLMFPGNWRVLSNGNRPKMLLLLLLLLLLHKVFTRLCLLLILSCRPYLCSQLPDWAVILPEIWWILAADVRYVLCQLTIAADSFVRSHRRVVYLRNWEVSPVY